jgi:corrinoid protein of di/trimethylamine methyltransferase
MDSKIALDAIRDALVKLDDAALSGEVARALDSGLSPVAVLEGGIAAGLRVLGEKFQCGEVFIPHLAVAADMARRQMEAARSKLPAEEAAPDGPTVIIGTVKDDIHDLGKSLVGSLLSVSGFNVVDLGKNVPEERFVEEVRAHGRVLVGMSALMTTTMVNQRAVIRGLEREGLRDKVAVMVGGAPTSDSWAEEIGADGHAEDVVSAVRLASALASRLMASGDSN